MSGETIPIAYKMDDKKLEEIIESSRRNYVGIINQALKLFLKVRKLKLI
jgi:hypothetical protein